MGLKLPYQHRTFAASQCAAAIILALAFLGLGTGVFQHLHELQHRWEDARADAVASASGKPIEPHHHDESNCDVHAQILLAFFLQSCALIVHCVGALVTFLILFDLQCVAKQVARRPDCRGPPLVSLRSYHIV